jgi:hypothetical protein
MAWALVYAFRSVGLCFHKCGRLYRSVCIMTRASIIKLSTLRFPWIKSCGLRTRDCSGYKLLHIAVSGNTSAKHPWAPLLFAQEESFAETVHISVIHL